MYADCVFINGGLTVTNRLSGKKRVPSMVSDLWNTQNLGHYQDSNHETRGFRSRN